MTTHEDSIPQHDDRKDQHKEENKLISNSKSAVSTSHRDKMQRFEELKRRREELTTFSRWKLQKIENKQLIKSTNSQKTQKENPEEFNFHASSSKSSPESDKEQEKEWEIIKTKYIDVNAHLSGPVSHGEPKSGLEEKINEALSKGDIEEAEQLSDQLSKRDFGVRLNDAFAAKRYDESKKIEEEIAKRKKSKKLHWGFQSKKRWEMKGNM